MTGAVVTGAVDVLVAGIGDILSGDDGFGVEVARRLARRPLPPNVRVVELGIRGFDLAAALSERPKLAILLDATSRGGPPGTLYVLEPGDLGAASAIDPHGLHPVRAIELARRLGGLPDVMRVIACEAKTLGSAEVPEMGLSPEVLAAVDPAIDLALGLVRPFLAPPDPGDARDA